METVTKMEVRILFDNCSMEQLLGGGGDGGGGANGDQGFKNERTIYLNDLRGTNIKKGFSLYKIAKHNTIGVTVWLEETNENQERNKVVRPQVFI